jgi:hypothetical protein
MSSVVKYLPELPHPGAHMGLDNKLSTVGRLSDDCLGHAQAIETEFVKWLKLCCELYLAICAKECNTTVSEDWTSTFKLAGVDIQTHLTGINVKSVIGAAQMLKTTMNKSHAMFNEVADSVPVRKSLSHVSCSVRFLIP